jgi:hypothetical protein
MSISNSRGFRSDASGRATPGNLELSNRQFVFPGKPDSQGRGLASRMMFGSIRSILGRVSNQTKAKLVFNVPRPSLVLEWDTLSR